MYIYKNEQTKPCGCQMADPHIEIMKRYARLAKGNVRNFQERTARTVYGLRYIAWTGYSFSVQVILTTSF